MISSQPVYGIYTCRSVHRYVFWGLKVALPMLPAFVMNAALQTILMVNVIIEQPQIQEYAFTSAFIIANPIGVG